ncbi:uncharacterized protein ARMOST_01591 [Armillaria ostoyae]|uniref:Uncharacterized protein n=1 Tax=Armillaria ostoyae TaxID=47428 RepID=A0A284QPD5_ARMOS|nr:uncharacterized protein ARMOST_01591 [Armillaria ostoyae]
MAAQTDIPSGLTNDNKVLLFQILEAQLNSTILYALLHGIYTGILAVTLWNILINKCWPIRRAMVYVIILLHALITISVAATWSNIHSAFIANGQSFWRVYLKLTSAGLAAYWETGIAASMSTILADLYVVYLVLLDGLGTTLACCSASNTFPGLRDCCGEFYLDVVAAIAKGIAPTLLVGRAAAGHTRPKDDCDESAVSTLRFQTPSELGTTSFPESIMQSAAPEMDIEAQPEQLVVFVEQTQCVHDGSG